MGGKFRKKGKYNARGRPKSASTARAAVSTWDSSLVSNVSFNGIYFQFSVSDTPELPTWATLMIYVSCLCLALNDISTDVSYFLLRRICGKAALKVLEQRLYLKFERGPWRILRKPRLPLDWAPLQPPYPAETGMYTENSLIFETYLQLLILWKTNASLKHGDRFIQTWFLCDKSKFSSVREKSEIEAFVKDAVAAGEHCLGRCLYISGVPGTGKVSGPNYFSLHLICMFLMCWVWKQDPEFSCCNYFILKCPHCCVTRLQQCWRWWKAWELKWTKMNFLLTVLLRSMDFVFLLQNMLTRYVPEACVYCWWQQYVRIEFANGAIRCPV